MVLIIRLLFSLALLSVISCESKSNTGEVYTDWDRLGGYADKQITPYGPNAKGE
jgi:hypothetical protein